ncbi:ester cyclase [Mycobacterium sp. GA-1999]|uniref:ester cyclase n=1 Tax=Mycobacterium sp. GA-1999 TaxID=1772275 RepID=UPI00155FC69C|nr:ester cyclase [Mycobacterium sp. GA-1999]
MVWIVTAVLAVAFLASGAMKVVQSREKLLDHGYRWAEGFTRSQIRWIGAAECLGAIGLIAPPIFRLWPVVSLAAAIGLTVLMVGAVIVHFRRHELTHTAAPAILAILTAALAVFTSGVFMPSDHKAIPVHEQQSTLHLDPEESTMVTPEESTNIATFERFHDATNSGDLQRISTLIDETFRPDAIFHAPVPTNESGPQAIKQVWTVLLQAFPDIHVTTNDAIAHHDKVVLRNTVTGTHQGDYRGLPPTGKTITYNEIFIARFTDGKIAEIWGVVDVYSQLRQLGVIPA